ncbi:MAG TPA: biosynthetic-type acetolactate synthase large subunit [Chloroflexota bacterium]|nr:biosynthetic-type acetolactate synthase large subunit [Chloroflexota bacterium]
MVALDIVSENTATAGRAVATRTLNGGALACEALLAAGVTTLFGYPGGAALPFYRELARYPALRHVLVRHEQNAAHAADGYARATGRVGVCVATSGPGATNLLTGLATAFMDCVPLVALTGQVARAAIGTQAFQEVDIVGMVGPITKGAFQLQSAADIPKVFAEAFRLASEGRPGPVLIDFPKDVQLSTVEVDADVFGHAPRAVVPELSPVARLALKQVAALLETSERPALVAGHGVAMAGAVAELLRFAEASGVPVGTTLLGLGVFPEQHPQALGMVGMHGTVQANLAMHHADLVIGVGMRFDDRVVGRPRDFAPQARIVHVDVDPEAFGRVVRVDVPVLADARVALHELASVCTRQDRTPWWARLSQWTDDHAGCGMIDADAAAPDEAPTTPEVIRALRRVMGGAATVVADIGQHQMFVALHHGFDRLGQMFTSGGLGTMGYGLPAAMGVKTALPGRTVWAVVGDGGFQMSAPELSTLVATNLPVKVLIVNNKCLGMVRQWQELFYDNVYSHSMLPQPDFAALARAHGCWATTVTRRDELESALREAALHPGPAVVDVHVPIEETVYPMVPAGSTPGDVRCVDAVDASAS